MNNSIDLFENQDYEERIQRNRKYEEIEEDEEEESSSSTSEQGDFPTRLKSLLKLELVEKFDTAYFAIIIGFAISANICYEFPYPSRWLRICGIIFFAFAVFFFLANLSLFIIGCCYHRERIYAYHTDRRKSSFIGAFVMGFITIITFIHHLVGEKHAIFVWTLWWIAVFLSMYCYVIFYLSYFSKLSKKYTLQDVNFTAILLPVTFVVVASNGETIAPSLPTLELRIVTELVSLALWSICCCFGLILIPIVMLRMMIYKIPDSASVFALFLPIGYVGQLSYFIMLFGKNMSQMIPNHNIAESFTVACGLVSFVLMSFGYLLTLLAIGSVLSKIKPFAKTPNPTYSSSKTGLLVWHKSFWSMNFPIGTMSLANIEHSRGTVGGYKIEFFRVVSAIYGVALILITICNSLGMLHYIYKRCSSLFEIRKNKYKYPSHEQQE